MSKEKPKSKTEAERIAFVISPVGDPDSLERKRADQILNHVISPIVTEFGYEAVRSDKITKPGIITSQIINHIINDPLVIADLTGHNPNVFYELALRHAIKKPVIQLIKRGERIPFDISTQRTIQIDHKDLDSVDEAKKELRKQVKAVEKDPTLVDSPLSVAIDLQFLRRSGDPERMAIVELRDIMQDVNFRVREVQNVLSTRLTLHPSGRAQCPQCSSGAILHDADTGEVICTNCGLVISEIEPIQTRLEQARIKQARIKKQLDRLAKERAIKRRKKKS